MRTPAIEHDLLARNYGRRVNPFWERFSCELRGMLTDKGKPTTKKGREAAITEEVMYIGKELLEGLGLPEPVPDIGQVVPDWAWYVSERVCPTLEMDEDVLDPPEEELLRELQADPLDGIKQVILVYGHTGHGKTTFLRHFFYHWIEGAGHGDFFKRHVVLRASMGLGCFGTNIENDYDNKIHRALAAAFPWVLEPEQLLAAAKHHHRFNDRALDRLEKEFPREGSLPDLIRWLNDFNHLYVPYSESDIYHDFNRLIVDYLTSTFGVHFFFVMDNIDQTPQTLQSRFYLLARHKLDWILDISRVTFILGVRSYLVDKVYKESVVQAFPDPPRIRIFPPPVHKYLAARINTFDSDLSQKRYDIPMPDGKRLNVKKQVLVNMLRRFNDNYSDPNNDVTMSRLSNYDIRRQADFVRACLCSVAIDWCGYAHFLSQGQEDVYFSQHDILRAILRVDNVIVAPRPEQMLLNIFSCGHGDHFANSLNKWYILKLLSRADRRVNVIVGLLEILGHPPCVSLTSLAQLLEANVVASPDGFRLKEDAIESLTLAGQRTSIGRELLVRLPFNLLYVEAMAYLTPLDEDLVFDVPIPKQHERPTFEESVHATALLVRQIRRDQRLQDEYAQADASRQQLYEENGLMTFADSVTDSVVDTLTRFRDRNIVSFEHWERAFGYFEEN